MRTVLSQVWVINSTNADGLLMYMYTHMKDDLVCTLYTDFNIHEFNQLLTMALILYQYQTNAASRGFPK